MGRLQIDVRGITAAEFDTYAAMPGPAFGWPALSAGRLENARASTELDRALAAFDGDELIGTAKAYSREVGVPGGLAPVAAVSFVSVARHRRRRGVLTQLMTTQLDEIAGREGLAMLWASESTIYGWYGYGSAGFRQRHELDLAGSGFSATGRTLLARFDGTLTETAAAAADAAVQEVLAAVAPTRPGMMTRPPEHCRRFRAADDSTERTLVARSADDRAVGYARFSFDGSWDHHFVADGRVSVAEAVCSDPAAEAAIWRYLLDTDLAHRLEAGYRPLPDPLALLLENERQLRPVAADGLWVRVLSVPDALQGRAFSARLDLVIEVVDDFRPAAGGRWRVVVPTAGSAASVSVTSAPADLVLPVAALGAGHLGSTSLISLSHAITEVTPGALLAASRAWSWHVPIWCPEMF